MLEIDQAVSFAEMWRVSLETIAGIDGVLRESPPAVHFAEVGDVANMLHVLYWTVSPTRLSDLTTKSLVTEQLSAAPLAAGISFPYPIQTLHPDEANGRASVQAHLGPTIGGREP